MTDEQTTADEGVEDTTASLQQGGGSDLLGGNDYLRSTALSYALQYAGTIPSTGGVLPPPRKVVSIAETFYRFLTK